MFLKRKIDVINKIEITNVIIFHLVNKNNDDELVHHFEYKNRYR